jgi:hypothetical protein
VRFGSDETVAVQLVGRRQIETGVVGVSVDVVGLHGVTPAGGREIEPTLDERVDHGTSYVKPQFLSKRRSIERIAFDRGGKLSGIGAKRFPAAGAEVADDAAAIGMQRSEFPIGGREQIDVVGVDR